MTDEPRRDPELQRAIESIAVPDYEAGFWDRLEARLSDEVPGGAEATPATGVPVVPPVLDAPVAAEPETIVVPLPTGAARGRDPRRRSLVLLGAAAAVALAVLAVRLGTTDDPDALRTASDATRTTLAGAADGLTTTLPSVPDDLRAADGGTADEGTAGGSPTTTTTRRGALSTIPPGEAGATTGPVELTRAGTAATPQDAFVTWATAIDSGDEQRVLDLTGRRTIAYYESLGVVPTDLPAEWQETWGAWADDDGRRIDLVDAGSVGDEQVTVVLLERPAPDPTDGSLYEAVPLVRTADDGWLVEPSAFDPDAESRIEITSPEIGEGGPLPMAPDDPIEVVAAADGDYTMTLDRTAASKAVAADDAVDGRISWKPGAKVLTPGKHLLLIVRVSPKTIIANAVPIVVEAQTTSTTTAYSCC